MTIVVEDGTGLPNAESYASVAEADTYLAARGITTWGGLQQPEKEQALRRATDYMSTYQWQGVRTVATQALDWPRMYVRAYDADVSWTVLPQAIKNACIELAWRGAAGPLLPDVKADDDSGKQLTKTVKKVGPIDIEKTYASRGPLSTIEPPLWSAVNVIVKEYVRKGFGVYR